ncbi:MAG: hypothetical protein RIT81_09820 [Deltaproteobacteria bacterium]
MERPTDEQLLQILAFADDADCVDERDIDQADLLALSRGHLASDRRASVDAHLERCASCRALLDAYREDLPKPVPRTPYVWAAAIAAAFTIFFATNGLDRSTAPDYAIVEVKGVVAEHMGEATPAPGRLTVATSTNLRLVLRPTSPTALGADVTAGVFVETPQGTYRHAPTRVEAVRDGGTVAFRIHVSGRALLEGRGTRDRIAVVIAESEAALNALDGSLTFERGTSGVIDVITRRVDAR